jgi:hypothetical protein
VAGSWEYSSIKGEFSCLDERLLASQEGLCYIELSFRRTWIELATIKYSDGHWVM